jgi:hypothetical protein
MPLLDPTKVPLQSDNGTTEIKTNGTGQTKTPPDPSPTKTPAVSGPDGDSGISASLLASGAQILGIAAAVTIIAFIIPAKSLETEITSCGGDSIANCSSWKFWQDWGNYLAVTAGLAAAVIAIGISAARGLFGHDTAIPERANPRQFGRLSERLSSLEARSRHVCPPEPPADGTPVTTAQKAACEEIATHRDFVAGELGVDGARRSTKKRSGTRWVLGNGFIDLWIRLHRAEAALFVVEPKAEVIADAFHDESRLIGSNIGNSDQLLRKLRAAVAILGGKKYLSSDAATLLQNVEASTDNETQSEARLILRDVRDATMEFRDKCREGLNQARNQLMWTGLVTGIIAYSMLALAILVGAERSAIIAAVAFFLMGAIVGLFAQLRSWSSGEGSGGDEDDFGLAQARLLYAPLLSGLAGVGGVLVATMLYASINGSIILGAGNGTGNQTTGNSTSGSVEAIETPHLEQIFDLREDRFGLVLAAIFGLTPELLINRLQGQADKYKVDLQSTNVQTRAV